MVGVTLLKVRIGEKGKEKKMRNKQELWYDKTSSIDRSRLREEQRLVFKRRDLKRGKRLATYQ